MTTLLLSLARGFGWLGIVLLFVAILCNEAVEMFYPGGLREFLKWSVSEWQDEENGAERTRKDRERGRRYFKDRK